MDKGLQSNLGIVEGLIQVQRDCITPGATEIDYMHGMLNGLIMAHSIFANIRNPKFHRLPPKNRKTKIRHKGKR